MFSLLLLMIVAGGSAAPTMERFPQASELFACYFDQRADRNYDGWPDGWVRQRGAGYPHYVDVRIVPGTSPQDRSALRVTLDGGAAAAFSPPLPINPRCTFVLQGRIRAEGLRNNHAYFSLAFLGPSQEVLETHLSRAVCDQRGWVDIQLGPLAQQSQRASYVQVGVHVVPQGPEQDLSGTVWFADIWLGQLPRLTLATSQPVHFFLEDESVEVHCSASGLPKETATVSLVLEDVFGRPLDQIELPFLGTPASEHAATHAQADTHGHAPLASGPSPAGQRGEKENVSHHAAADAGGENGVDWSPAVPGPGFYRVRATLRSRDALIHEGVITLAVVVPQGAPAQGEFGWSLPRAGEPVPHAELARLLSQTGVNWIKYPLWLGADVDADRLTRLLLFFERLNGQGIEVVGLLDHPPPKLRETLGGANLMVADIFALDAKIWGPSLEGTVAQAASRVRRWQLGSDDDLSFVGYPGLAGKIAEVKGQFDRLGTDVQLGVAWNWLEAMPAGAGGKPACAFLAMSADPPLTHEEMANYLEALPPDRPAPWLVLRPLSRKNYSLETRAEDLVRRMAAAKIHRAEAVFCPCPFDDERGLMNADGTPGELLLPWRTTATLLGGSEYLGSLELPQGSPNLVFGRGDEAVMLLWNDEPTEEALFFGERAGQVSLWGEPRGLALRGSSQVAEAAPLPAYVTGLHAGIARWSISCKLQHDRIPSSFGEPHANAISWTNAFPQGVSGRAELVLPESWRVQPNESNFRLAAGESLSVPFTVTLPFDANSGRHLLRVDFHVEADKSYHFSVYRPMQVGIGSVYIETATRLNDQGELEVEQRFVNDTDEPVSFRCYLYAPDRRRQKIDVRHLGPGRDVQMYRFPDGRELLDKFLWLRAEEIGGQRVLNYRFVAKGGGE